MTETPRVLVAAASAAGSTREIAERIAAGLTGAEVVVRRADPDLDVSGFDAVVVGSAVHEQAWLPAALHLLRRHRAVLGDRPVWCFSVGGLAPDGPVSRRLVAAERVRIERAFPSGLRPRDHAVFRGVVATRGMPLWGRAFWRAVGGRPGDHRNWPAIDAWAAGIAAELAALVPREVRTGTPPTDGVPVGATPGGR